ncbi:hypothetical protein ACOME3_004400 [Neoechinorhynchus agilis]
MESPFLLTEITRISRHGGSMEEEISITVNDAKINQLRTRLNAHLKPKITMTEREVIVKRASVKKPSMDDIIRVRNVLASEMKKINR